MGVVVLLFVVSVEFFVCCWLRFAIMCCNLLLFVDACLNLLLFCVAPRHCMSPVGCGMFVLLFG